MQEDAIKENLMNTKGVKVPSELEQIVLTEETSESTATAANIAQEDLTETKEEEMMTIIINIQMEMKLG